MSAVRQAAAWLRAVLPADGTPLDRALLRRWAERDDITWKAVENARERAGVGWRRRGWGGETVWFISGPPTPNYAPVEKPFHPGPPKGFHEPTPWPENDETEDYIGLCPACASAWVVDGPGPARCRTLGCNRLLERTEREVVRQRFTEPTEVDPPAPEGPNVGPDGLAWCSTCETAHMPDLRHCNRCRTPSMAPAGTQHAGCHGFYL